MSDRKLAITHYNRGCDLIVQNCDAEALKEFERAIECDAHLTSALVNAGNCLRRGSRYDEATYYYIKAIELDNKNMLAHFNYGCNLLCMDRYQDAVYEFEIASQIDPKHAHTQWKLAQCYAILGMSFKGIRYAIKAILFNPCTLIGYLQFVEVVALALCNCVIKATRK